MATLDRFMAGVNYSLDKGQNVRDKLERRALIDREWQARQDAQNREWQARQDAQNREIYNQQYGQLIETTKNPQWWQTASDEDIGKTKGMLNDLGAKLGYNPVELTDISEQSFLADLHNGLMDMQNIKDSDQWDAANDMLKRALLAKYPKYTKTALMQANSSMLSNYMPPMPVEQPTDGAKPQTPVQTQPVQPTPEWMNNAINSSEAVNPDGSKIFPDMFMPGDNVTPDMQAEQIAANNPDVGTQAIKEIVTAPKIALTYDDLYAKLSNQFRPRDQMNKREWDAILTSKDFADFTVGQIENHFNKGIALGYTTQAEKDYYKNNALPFEVLAAYDYKYAQIAQAEKKLSADQQMKLTEMKQKNFWNQKEYELDMQKFGADVAYKNAQLRDNDERIAISRQNANTSASRLNWDKSKPTASGGGGKQVNRADQLDTKERNIVNAMQNIRKNAKTGKLNPGQLKDLHRMQKQLDGIAIEREKLNSQPTPNNKAEIQQQISNTIDELSGKKAIKLEDFVKKQSKADQNQIKYSISKVGRKEVIRKLKEKNINVY